MAAPQMYTIEGGARFRRTLRAAGVAMSDFKALNKEVANIVVPVARALAPMDARGDGGQLAGSIRSGATQSAAIIRVGGGSVKYAPVVHYWQKGNFKPNPFVSVAAQQTEPAWLERYYQGIDKILDTIEGQ